MRGYEEGSNGVMQCGRDASREEQLLSSRKPGEAGQRRGEVNMGDVKTEPTGEPLSIELPGGVFVSSEFFWRERMRGPFGKGGREGRSRASEERRGDNSSARTESI